MAYRQDLGGGGTLFVGEDVEINFEILPQGANVTDPSVQPIDISGWGLTFVVRATESPTSPPLLTVPATVVGTYNVVRATNSQRARVTLTDSDLAAAVFQPGTYKHSLKRTDDGSEKVVSYGDFEVEQATQV